MTASSFTLPPMGRVTATVRVRSYLEPAKELVFEVLVDTGATLLTVPRAWKERFGNLAVLDTVAMETADGRRVAAEICGPVQVQIQGFQPVSDDLAFVDMVGHRLVQAPAFDLKRLAS